MRKYSISVSGWLPLWCHRDAEDSCMHKRNLFIKKGRVLHTQLFSSQKKALCYPNKSNIDVKKTLQSIFELTKKIPKTPRYLRFDKIIYLSWGWVSRLIIGWFSFDVVVTWRKFPLEQSQMDPEISSSFPN